MTAAEAATSLGVGLLSGLAGLIAGRVFRGRPPADEASWREEQQAANRRRIEREREKNPKP